MDEPSGTTVTWRAHSGEEQREIYLLAPSRLLFSLRRAETAWGVRRSGDAPEIGLSIKRVTTAKKVRQGWRKIWKTQKSPSWILFEEVMLLLKPEKWSEWMGGNLVQVKEKGSAKALRQERNWHIWETEEVLGLRSSIPQVHNPAPLFTSYLTLASFWMSLSFYFFIYKRKMIIVPIS